MPGGAAFVALKRTKQPALVAKFLDFLAQDANYKELMVRTDNIPASATVAKGGLGYDMSPAAKAAIGVFAADVPKIAPAAYALQGYRFNRAIFLPTAQRIGQAVAGELSVDDAIKRLQAEVAEKSTRLGLIEDQARVAMDLYRRIALLTLESPDPVATERALRAVSGSVAAAAADKLGLTSRDLQIIELLAQGCSNREIADAVHLSPNTVKDNVSRIMRALGARSRAGVVALASRHGLIAET